MSSTTSTQQQLDIAIIGGGIAGLTLAIGLLKIPHLKLTIYEAAHHFGEIGAGVSLGPSSIRAMRGISPAIESGFYKVATPNGFDSHKDVWFDFRVGEGEKSGERFYQVRLPENEFTYGVHRAHFLDELIKLIPDGIAKFGQRVVGVEEVDEMVKLKFKNGEEVVHQCVIGADGIHSELRKFILGPEDPASYAVFSGKYCHRGLAPMDEAVAVLGDEMARNAQIYFGKHAHMLTFPVDHGKTFNAVAFGSCEQWESDKWVVPSSFRDINKDFAAFGPPVQKIICLMRVTDIWALFNHLPARTYIRNNVVIIGDAAHATTPHQGSGAGMAIEDAFVLSSLMARVKTAEDLGKCLVAFDAVRRERGNRLVETSREAGGIWEMEHPETGEDLDKIAENASTRLNWIWLEDLNEEVRKGQETMSQ